MDKRMNLTMLTDFYEITMANGYFESGMADDIAYFDMFFRRVPDDGGYAIMAGLEQLIDYVKNLKFDGCGHRISAQQKYFLTNEFLDVSGATLSSRVMSGRCRRGRPIFPHEPIVTVRGPAIQAQFIETMLLLTINHQSHHCHQGQPYRARGRGQTRSWNSVRRRAHGYGRARYMGARAAYIARLRRYSLRHC